MAQSYLLTEMRMLSNKKNLYVMKELETWFQKNVILKIFKTNSSNPNEFRLPNEPRVVFNNMEAACKPEVRF
jgi:hypothetical protein